MMCVSICFYCVFLLTLLSQMAWKEAGRNGKEVPSFKPDVPATLASPSGHPSLGAGQAGASGDPSTEIDGSS